VHVVVATPGRAHRPHQPGHAANLDAVEMVVLDEADEMLDMGFAEDLDAILDATPTPARPCCSRPRCRRASTPSPSAT
jgi:ATP-dependent RNA helicase DeaD